MLLAFRSPRTPFLDTIRITKRGLLRSWTLAFVGTHPTTKHIFRLAREWRCNDVFDLASVAKVLNFGYLLAGYTRAIRRLTYKVRPVDKGAET